MIGRQLCVLSACSSSLGSLLSILLTTRSTYSASPTACKSSSTSVYFSAIITTIVASVSWQLVALAFAIAFLSNPFTYIFLHICLGLEASDIYPGAWVLSDPQKRSFGFQRDEVYIGTAEDRGAKNMGDDSDRLQLGPGHLIKLPGIPENAPASLKALTASDPAVVEYHKMDNGESNVDNIEKVEDGTHDSNLPP
jgi:hypothetical protein